MTTYWVRPARAADLKAVRELARRVRREFQLSVRTPERAGTPRASELLWVVEAGRGQIVGCCGVHEGEGGAWELESLYLAPDWRGFGLGRALVEQAIRSVQQAGGLRLACRVPGDLPEAVSLLRRLGFEDAEGEPPQQRRLVRTLARIS
jgi:N-acetylglutamate synthase-like GNAT family acetyltransferase